MSCIGKYHECSRCYHCDPDVRHICEIYKAAFDDLHSAQSMITMAFDEMEQSAKKLGWMIEHD